MAKSLTKSERQRIYQDVQNFRRTPEEAESLAKGLFGKGFEQNPDPVVFDPMREDEWTLPMAAAWFIWRSNDAVRDQWSRAREEWLKWIESGTPGPGLHRFRSRRRRLVKFGKASLTKLYSLTSGGERAHNQGSDAVSGNPWERFKEALQSGNLVATRGRHGSEISHDYWRRSFYELTHERTPLKNSPPPHPLVVAPRVKHVGLKNLVLESSAEDSSPGGAQDDSLDLGPEFDLPPEEDEAIEPTGVRILLFRQRRRKRGVR